MKKYVYGIDVGGTTVKIGLFNSSGELVDKWEVSTNTNDNGTNILRDIASSIKDYELGLEQIEGYGFGVPGPVHNTEVLGAVNLGWGHLDLKLEFQKYIDSDNIFVANDANVAALGEAVLGAAKGAKDAAMLTLGTGVGSGIIVDGKIVEGFNGGAGEIGHLKVTDDPSLPCNCGNQGCLETVASATGIKNHALKVLNESTKPSVLRGYSFISAKDVFDAAIENDELALEIVEYTTYYIAYACYILAVTTNPQAIVIGGGVSKAGTFLLEHIQNHFEKMVFKPVKNTIITLATLGNDAGIYGAASLVIKHD